jgi:hypothetical protein
MMGLAVGLFLLLSVLVFGTMLYVGFTSVNTEVVLLDTDVDDGFTGEEGVRVGEYIMSQDPNLGIRRGPIEIVPDRKPGIIRGPIEILPDYSPFQRRGPIEIMPDYNPFLGIHRPPIYLLPI